MTVLLPGNSALRHICSKNPEAQHRVRQPSISLCTAPRAIGRDGLTRATTTAAIRKRPEGSPSGLFDVSSALNLSDSIIILQDGERVRQYRKKLSCASGENSTASMSAVARIGVSRSSYAVFLSFLVFTPSACCFSAKLFFSADIRSTTGASFLAFSGFGPSWPLFLLSISFFTLT
jgi:hypothetical protein